MQIAPSKNTFRAALLCVVFLVLAGNPVVASGHVASFEGSGIASAAAILQVERDGIAFSFDPAVSDTDRNDIVEGTRLGIEIIGGFVGNAGLNGAEIWASEDESAGGPGVMAATRGSQIVVYTGGHAWQRAPTIIRLETMVHELMHVYQNALEGDRVSTVPLWFDEGTAEALGYLAITLLGVVDQRDIYDLNLFSLTRAPVEGSLAALAPYGSMTANAYPLAYIAVQYLLGRSGLSVSALADVYEGIGRGFAFDSAFSATFGQSLGEFYVMFDRWRAGLLSVAAVPREFMSARPTGQPAPAAWSTVQVRVQAGHQLTLVAQTQPGTECALQLALPNDPVERQTIASGTGDALWLVTIPDDTAPGLLLASVSCGIDSVWQLVEVM